MMIFLTKNGSHRQYFIKNAFLEMNTVAADGILSKLKVVRGIL